MHACLVTSQVPSHVRHPGTPASCVSRAKEAAESGQRPRGLSRQPGLARKELLRWTLYDFQTTLQSQMSFGKVFLSSDRAWSEHGFVEKTEQQVRSCQGRDWKERGWVPAIRVKNTSRAGPGNTGVLSVVGQRSSAGGAGGYTLLAPD